MTPCPACSDHALHALAEALAMDDIDNALTLGLLASRPEGMADPCPECRTRMQLVIAARDDRLRALAARERYRARQLRLAERAETLAHKRAAATTQPSAAAPSLPLAAAEALARAKARVAAKSQRE